MTFWFLIRAHNAGEMLNSCVRSLERQKYDDWRALLFLDNPTLKTINAAVDKLIEKEYNNMSVIVEAKRGGPARSMYHGIKTLAQTARPEDAIAVLDGDDELIDADALTTVKRTYDRNPEALLTYGSYWKASVRRRTKVSNPYRIGDNVRTAYWHASHLKTFKAKLANHVEKEWFLTSDGNYLEAASDLALMMPLMEIAGMQRCIHIHDLLYIWNDNHGGNCDRQIQKKCEAIVRNKPPLLQREEL